MARPSPLAAGLLLALAAGARAPAAEAPLSLAEALARAEAHNPELAALRERSDAQAARADSTRRAALPRLSLLSGWTYSDNPAVVFAQKLNAREFTQEDFAITRLNSPDARAHLTTLLSVEAPVDLAGRVKLGADAQSAAERAYREGSREGVQEIRLRVIEAYRNARLAARATAVNELALQAARARESGIEARVSEGAALQADLLRARARRREREADLAERRGQERMARAGLARLLGESDAGFALLDEPEAPPPLAGDAADWVARGLRQRPLLAVSEARLEAARLAARAEQRSGWPELGVFGQLQDDRGSFTGGGRSATIGAGLRWGVFDASRGRRLGAARAETRAAEQDARAARDQVRLEVELAYRRAQTVRERYAAAQGGAREGREALRVVQERRAAGLATLTDELETEAAAVSAELAEIQAAAGAAVADAALRRAAGEL